MSQHQMALPDLVVEAAATTSNDLKAEDRDATTGVASGSGFRDADSITIHAPDTLTEVATVHVAEAETGGNFNALQRPAGTDVVIGVGDSVTIDGISFKALRIVLDGAAGATRTFKVTKSVWV